MKILAIETSGPTLSLALMEDNNILAEYSIFTSNLHDKFCAKFASRLLKDNSSNIDDIAAIAVSIGPGSFTGLRIGTAFAKGLTFENKPKLIAVPTFAAMLDNASNFINNFISNLNSLRLIDRNIFCDVKFLNKFKILAIAPSHSNLYYYQELSAAANLSDTPNIIEYDELLSIYTKQPVFITTTYELELPFGVQVPELSKIKASVIGKYAFNLFDNAKFENNNAIVLSEEAVPTYIQKPTFKFNNNNL